MLPHDEPMTDKQFRYLRHLIHPSEWHTIRMSMTKEEASKRIEQCILENASDQAATRALSAPTSTWSLRHDGPIAASPNQRQLTLGDLLPRPDPEPPKCSYTRDQLLELHSIFDTEEPSTIMEAIRDLTEAEIDEFIVLAKKEKELEQEAERKEAAERRVREAEERREEVKRYRLESGLPAVAPPGDERITDKQFRLLMELLGAWAVCHISAMTKKEAWSLIRRLLPPRTKQSQKASVRLTKTDRAYLEADIGGGWAD